MGSSHSSTVINDLVKSITNISTNIVQDCVVNSTQSQTTSINNSGFTLGQSIGVSQATTISDLCWSSTNLQTKLQNEIINTIQQAAKSNSIALLPTLSGSSSDASTVIKDLITTNVTLSNIQKNYNDIVQKQNTSISNSGLTFLQSIDVTQGAKVFAAATLQTVADTGILNSISQALDQTSTASTNSPLDIFAGMNLGAYGVYIVVFLVVIAIAIFGYHYMSGKKYNKKMNKLRKYRPDIDEELKREHPRIIYGIKPKNS